MEIVTVVLQVAGVAIVGYGLVLAMTNGLGHALINGRRRAKVDFAA